MRRNVSAGSFGTSFGRGGGFAAVVFSTFRTRRLRRI
jgi:hypothetical protein